MRILFYLGVIQLSKENHPNIHAVNTMIEIGKVINENLRGNALAKRTPSLPYILLGDEIQEFIVKISEKLDRVLGEE